MSDENAAGRLADMNLEGRDVAVIIPGTCANGLTGIRDVILAEGLYRAYHRIPAKAGIHSPMPTERSRK